MVTLTNFRFKRYPKYHKQTKLHVQIPNLLSYQFRLTCIADDFSHVPFPLMIVQKRQVRWVSLCYSSSLVLSFGLNNRSVRPQLCNYSHVQLLIERKSNSHRAGRGLIAVDLWSILWRMRVVEQSVVVVEVLMALLMCHMIWYEYFDYVRHFLEKGNVEYAFYTIEWRNRYGKAIKF